MKHKEDLFQLIRSMSKSEKRYFTLDAQKSGQRPSKYLELFQLINEMEKYSEEKLRKKFGRNLPYDKSYLYEAILRSMRDYRSSKSRAARIRELLLDARYLYERGLYLQCEERLRDARQVAESLGDQLALLEINKEMRNITWDLKRRSFREEVQALIDEKETHLEAVGEEFKYLDMLYELLLKNIKGTPKAAMEELEKEGYLSLIEERGTPRAVHARRRYFQCAALLSQMKGDPEAALAHYEKVVDWWEQNEAYRQEEFYRYVIDLSNFLSFCYTNKKLEYMPPVLSRLENSEPKNFHDQQTIFQNVSTFKLIYHINLGIAEGVDSLVESIEKGMQKFQINIVTQTVLTFNTAILLFIVEKFEACRYWLLKIIKGERFSERKDIKTGAYLLHLIAVYEIDEIDLLESTYRSTYRYVHKELNAPSGSFERAITYGVKRLLDAPPGKKRENMRKLQEKVQAIKQDPAQRVPLGLDDLALYWINSRLESKSLAKVMNG
ncbi:MAG: hypothetical protein KDD06_10845 [Phaeodactylibacter sp.]|nr:hypothetical protein [Phaeodactylibacter sp.]MCB9266139.1 hypothetical protein [Lewinellaceae bacterium]MCB9286273.1 hypothetical protein [Lewinellaceae bacterium]